jgi:hypothetical protein
VEPTSEVANPAAHEVHTCEPAELDFPRPQKPQLDASWALNRPAKHVAHPDEPAAWACLPAAHAVHADVPDPLKRPVGHCVQFAERPLENVPASHGVQVVAALRAPVCDPALHVKHEPVRAWGA